MNARRFAPPLAALVAGLAQAASIASPWNGQPQWWLQLISLAALATLLRGEQRVLGAARLAWLFAVAWLAGTFWWLFISMHVYGGLPAPLAVAAVFALAAALGLYYALAGALFVRWRPAGALGGAVLFASLWLGAELLRATWFTGFPWGAGGYAHVDGPLSATARFVGVYGVGGLAALLAHLAASLASPAARSWRYWIAAAAAVGLLAACNVAASSASASVLPSGTRLKVALLQGNIPQDEKFQAGTGIPLALAWYAQQLRAPAAPLVVAPETAIPLLPQQLPEGYMAQIEASVRQHRHAALVGVPLGSFGEGYSNSVIGLQPGGAPYRYDKHHLVPFGEFVPPLFRWFTQMMDIPLGDFNRGAVGQSSFTWQGERLAPNVCYEDLFGEEFAARFRDPASAPTIFVNLSNIGWFGNTVAIDQHLQISRMRALEFERPMLRATNTGATVVIDRHGRVTHSLPRHTRGVLVGEVEGGSTLTPFARWASHFGLWPLWLLAVAVPLAFALRRRGV